MITNLKGIGTLKADETIPEWLVATEPVAIPLLDGEPLEFNIAIDNLSEDLVPAVESAISNFLALDPSRRDEISPKLEENYQEARAGGASDDLGIASPADTWRHIRPLRVNVQQGGVGDDAVYVQIVFGCDWEEEHGLQVVFREGAELIRVSQEDGHMTDEDAYGK